MCVVFFNVLTINSDCFLKQHNRLVDLILPAALWPGGSTQPLTEMSIRNLLAGKGRPARKADNLTAICEPIV
jgi:hypothetical protein